MARSSSGSSGWRRSTSRLVRRLVSGVRNSWPASSTSRCCSARERSSDSSIDPNATPRRLTSSLPVAGTLTSKRPVARTVSAADVRRRSVAVTRAAISEPSSVAAAVTRTTRTMILVRNERSTRSTSVERASDLHGAVGQPGRAHTVAGRADRDRVDDGSARLARRPTRAAVVGLATPATSSSRTEPSGPEQLSLVERRSRPAPVPVGHRLVTADELATASVSETSISAYIRSRASR